MTKELKALIEMDPMVAAVIQVVSSFPGDSKTYASGLRAALAMFESTDELLSELAIAMQSHKVTFQGLGQA